jgi:hypothetical protein
MATSHDSAARERLSAMIGQRSWAPPNASGVQPGLHRKMVSPGNGQVLDKSRRFAVAGPCILPESSPVVLRRDVPVATCRKAGQHDSQHLGKHAVRAPMTRDMQAPVTCDC